MSNGTGDIFLSTYARLFVDIDYYDRISEFIRFLADKNRWSIFLFVFKSKLIALGYA